MMFGANTMENADAEYTFDQTFGKAGIRSDQTYYPGLRAGKKACDEASGELIQFHLNK